MLISKKRTINITIRNTSSLTPASTRLDGLDDVDPTNEIDGASLVYDANTDVYVVKKLDFDEIEGELDGGTF